MDVTSSLVSSLVVEGIEGFLVEFCGHGVDSSHLFPVAVGRVARAQGFPHGLLNESGSTHSVGLRRWAITLLSDSLVVCTMADQGV